MCVYCITIASSTTRMTCSGVGNEKKIIRWVNSSCKYLVARLLHHMQEVHRMDYESADTHDVEWLMVHSIGRWSLDHLSVCVVSIYKARLLKTNKQEKTIAPTNGTTCQCNGWIVDFLKTTAQEADLYLSMWYTFQIVVSPHDIWSGYQV